MADPRESVKGERELEELLVDELNDQAELAGLGYSQRPEDMIYTGEDGGLDPDDWIWGHLGPVHPAENLLRRMIRESDAAIDHEQLEGRLKQALAVIFGVKRARGRTARAADIDICLIAIGKLYWERCCGDSRADVPLAPIIREAFRDPELRQIDARDPNDQDFQKYWSRQFKGNLDRILKRVTGEVDEAQTRRQALESRAFNAMCELGFWRT